MEVAGCSVRARGVLLIELFFKLQTAKQQLKIRTLEKELGSCVKQSRRAAPGSTAWKSADFCAQSTLDLFACSEFRGPPASRDWVGTAPCTENARWAGANGQNRVILAGLR